MPIEVIVRNIAAGSLSKRLGLPEGTHLNCTVLEYCYKNDDLGDPMINDYHIAAMGLATKEEMEQISSMALKINELLTDYLRTRYPALYLVSSTTKVLTDFEDFRRELDRKEFRYVVPDFRLNKRFEELNALSQVHKDKVEFLCNECCWFGCNDRKQCYEVVSRKNLGEDCEHRCKAPDAQSGYRFSKAMENPGFIGVDAVLRTYLPMGFSQFKIEGRGLGSALILEFLLYYMTKPAYQLRVREEIYLDNMLDLF